MSLIASPENNFYLEISSKGENCITDVESPPMTINKTDKYKVKKFSRSGENLVFQREILNHYYDP